MGKIFQPNWPKKQAGVASVISNKIDLKLKSIKTDKEGHFILVIGKIHKKKSQYWTSMSQIQGHPHM